MRYWCENFSKDMEMFAEFWTIMAKKHALEFPDKMTLQDWDDQFVQWLNRKAKAARQ